MRHLLLPLCALALALPLAGTAHAAEGWHKNLKEGLEAAAKSGKPVLVITGWAKGV